MSKDRDGSVRARRCPDANEYTARYKYNGRWYQVKHPGIVCRYREPSVAREAAYAMYNVAVNGGEHQ